MKEPRWLKDAVVDAIHNRQLAEHGGLAGVRDPGLLSSALARPKNLFAYGEPEPDVAALAAAYAFGIIKNHPFVDGNKRTAYVVCRAFLKLNGADIVAAEADRYLTIVSVADDRVSDEAFAEWLRAHLVTLPRKT
jgi:death on curing protein